MLTLNNIIAKINRKIHNAKAKLGGDSVIQDIINEALRTIQLHVDFPSAKRKSTPFLVFHNVFDYSLPADISYDKIARLMFETEETNKSSFEKTKAKYLFSSRNPYRYKNVEFTGFNDIEVVAVDFKDGSPFLNLRLSEDLGAATLHTCESITANGTWAVSGDGSGLRVDNYRYKEGSASLAFDCAGTSVILTNSDITAIDLSGYELKGKLFCWVYFPDSVPSSITLNWGSDSANYFSKAATVCQNGLPFSSGWNLVGFDWETATETGTVVTTAIDYLVLSLTFATSVTATAMKMDYFFCSKGKECSLDYYSKYLVSSNADVRQEEFSAGDDYTILKEKEVDILVDEAVQSALENLREFNEAKDRERIKKENIAQIQNEYPSEEELDSITYYNI